MTCRIRVELPSSLCLLARTPREILLQVESPTPNHIIDALEASHPALRGTLRDQGTRRRRPFIRFFACQTDVSHDCPDEPLPDAIASGAEPFLVVGAIAGG